MHPLEMKERFITLRAQGKSYGAIAKDLHISTNTCSAWEADLKDQIDALKKEELNTLYTFYHMTKEARIRELGATLEKINGALDAADLTATDPAQLLRLKLKYMEALREEYTGTPAASRLNEVNPHGVMQALADLLERVRNGEATADQAAKEGAILSELLKTYELVELEPKLDQLRASMDGGQ